MATITFPKLPYVREVVRDIPGTAKTEEEEFRRNLWHERSRDSNQPSITTRWMRQTNSIKS